MGNKSNVKNMLREAGILFGITLAAGFLLGVVYELTKEPIRVQQEKAVQEACAEAFPASGEAGGASYEFQAVEYELDADFLAQLAENGVRIGSVYLAVSDGAESGGIPADYAGYVVEAVSSEGYDGDIVLYVGKSGASADNEVDAITGATVTTSAVVNAVNGGLETARYLTEDPGRITGRKGGEGNE